MCFAFPPLLGRGPPVPSWFPPEGNECRTGARSAPHHGADPAGNENRRWFTCNEAQECLRRLAGFSQAPEGLAKKEVAVWEAVGAAALEFFACVFPPSISESQQAEPVVGAGPIVTAFHRSAQKLITFLPPPLEEPDCPKIPN